MRVSNKVTRLVRTNLTYGGVRLEYEVECLWNIEDTNRVDAVLSRGFDEAWELSKTVCMVG